MRGKCKFLFYSKKTIKLLNLLFVAVRFFDDPKSLKPNIVTITFLICVRLLNRKTGGKCEN